MFTQEWTADIRDQERYVTYRCFRNLFEAERYLSDIGIFCFRVALTQLRLGVFQEISACTGTVTAPQTETVYFAPT